MMSNSDSKNKSKGMRRSFIVHALLLLIFFLYSFKTETKDQEIDKPPYPVVLEFQFEESSLSTYAHADVGESRPENLDDTEVERAPEEVTETEQPQEEPVKEPTPTPVVTTPTDPIVTKTTVNEGPVKATESDVVIDEPVKEKVPVKTAPPKVDPTPTKTETPVKVNTPGSGGTDGRDKLPSKTDGNGTGKGDSGTGKGSDSGNDNTSGVGSGSDGSGAYDGSGNGIFGRKVIYKNWGQIPMTKKGKIVIKTCINRSGLVTFTEIMEDECTIKDAKTLKQAMIAAKGYKFQPDVKSPKEECGKLVINISGDAIPGIRGNKR